jgi:hypothetical protein
MCKSEFPLSENPEAQISIIIENIVSEEVLLLAGLRFEISEYSEFQTDKPHRKIILPHACPILHSCHSLVRNLLRVYPLAVTTDDPDVLVLFGDFHHFGDGVLSNPIIGFQNLNVFSKI